MLSRTNMNNKPPIMQISLNQIYKKIPVSSNLNKYIFYIFDKINSAISINYGSFCTNIDQRWHRKN